MKEVVYEWVVFVDGGRRYPIEGYYIGTPSKRSIKIGELTGSDSPG
jgi:hypothetical protein